MSSTIATEIATQSAPCYSWYLKFDGNVLDATNSDPKMVELYNSITGTSQEDFIKKATIKALTTTYNVNARDVAGDNSITKMLIYSVDYQAKEDIKAHMDAWNDVVGRAEEDKVHYSDSTAMLFFAMNSMVDAVKIVLICFTSISLVVSSIMIGIITYVSVVERTKEIGVLRAIGARKKDVSRIFNAETFLIGLLAGLIGIVVTYLLTIPINLIINSLLTGVSNLASLRIVDAIILIVVSFALTLVAGIIPSRIAAKKDPVVALRSE
jgi:putative ABC transport system permease protein